MTTEEVAVGVAAALALAVVAFSGQAPPSDTIPGGGVTVDMARQISSGFVAAYPDFNDASLDTETGILTTSSGTQYNFDAVFQTWENMVTSFIPVLTSHVEVAHLWNAFTAAGTRFGLGFPADMGRGIINTWLAQLHAFDQPPPFLLTNFAGGGQAIEWDIVKGYSGG